jgi:malate synthase
MSLDVKVMNILDQFAQMEVGDNIKDGGALEYINELAKKLPPKNNHLLANYRKYYFNAKRHYKERKDEDFYDRRSKFGEVE